MSTQKLTEYLTQYTRILSYCYNNLIMAKIILLYWSLATFKLGPAIHLFRTRSKKKVVPVTPDGNGVLVPPIETIIESFNLTMHWSDTGSSKFLKDPAIQDWPLKAATDETGFPLKPPTRSMTSTLDGPCWIVSSDMCGSEMMKKSPKCSQACHPWATDKKNLQLLVWVLVCKL